MKTVVTLIGTRPEVIKMAPIIRELEHHSTAIRDFVIPTGQQRHMLDQACAAFDIHPDRDLNLMRPGQTLAQLTAALFETLDQTFAELQPDWVLAQGDTTTIRPPGASFGGLAPAWRSPPCCPNGGSSFRCAWARTSTKPCRLASRISASRRSDATNPAPA